MKDAKRGRKLLRKSATKLMELADRTWWVDMLVEHCMSKKYDYEKLDVYINGIMEPIDPMIPMLEYYTFEELYRSIFPSTVKAVREIWGMKVRQNEEECYG